MTRTRKLSFHSENPPRTGNAYSRSYLYYRKLIKKKVKNLIRCEYSECPTPNNEKEETCEHTRNSSQHFLYGPECGHKHNFIRHENLSTVTTQNLEIINAKIKKAGCKWREYPTPNNGKEESCQPTRNNSEHNLFGPERGLKRKFYQREKHSTVTTQNVKIKNVKVYIKPSEVALCKEAIKNNNVLTIPEREFKTIVCRTYRTKEIYERYLKENFGIGSEQIDMHCSKYDTDVRRLYTDLTGLYNILKSYGANPDGVIRKCLGQQRDIKYILDGLEEAIVICKGLNKKVAVDLSKDKIELSSQVPARSMPVGAPLGASFGVCPGQALQVPAKSKSLIEKTQSMHCHVRLKKIDSSLLFKVPSITPRTVYQNKSNGRIPEKEILGRNFDGDSNKKRKIIEDINECTDTPDNFKETSSNSTKEKSQTFNAHCAIQNTEIEENKPNSKAESRYTFEPLDSTRDIEKYTSVDKVNGSQLQYKHGDKNIENMKSKRVSVITRYADGNDQENLRKLTEKQTDFSEQEESENRSCQEDVSETIEVNASQTGAAAIGSTTSKKSIGLSKDTEKTVKSNEESGKTMHRTVIRNNTRKAVFNKHHSTLTDNNQSINKSRSLLEKAETSCEAYSEEDSPNVNQSKRFKYSLRGKKKTKDLSSTGSEEFLNIKNIEISKTKLGGEVESTSSFLHDNELILSNATVAEISASLSHKPFDLGNVTESSIGSKVSSKKCDESSSETSASLTHKSFDLGNEAESSVIGEVCGKKYDEISASLTHKYFHLRNEAESSVISEVCAKKCDESSAETSSPLTHKYFDLRNEVESSIIREVCGKKCESSASLTHKSFDLENKDESSISSQVCGKKIVEGSAETSASLTVKSLDLRNEAESSISSQVCGKKIDESSTSLTLKSFDLGNEVESSTSSQVCGKKCESIENEIQADRDGGKILDLLHVVDKDSGNDSEDKLSLSSSSDMHLNDSINSADEMEIDRNDCNKSEKVCSDDENQISINEESTNLLINEVSDVKSDNSEEKERSSDKCDDSCTNLLQIIETNSENKMSTKSISYHEKEDYLNSEIQWKTDRFDNREKSCATDVEFENLRNAVKKDTRNCEEDKRSGVNNSYHLKSVNNNSVVNIDVKTRNKIVDVTPVKQTVTNEEKFMINSTTMQTDHKKRSIPETKDATNEETDLQKRNSEKSINLSRATDNETYHDNRSINETIDTTNKETDFQKRNTDQAINLYGGTYEETGFETDHENRIINKTIHTTNDEIDHQKRNADEAINFYKTTYEETALETDHENRSINETIDTTNEETDLQKRNTEKSINLFTATYDETALDHENRSINETIEVIHKETDFQKRNTDEVINLFRSTYEETALETDHENRSIPETKDTTNEETDLQKRNSEKSINLSRATDNETYHDNRSINETIDTSNKETDFQKRNTNEAIDLFRATYEKTALETDHESRSINETIDTTNEETELKRNIDKALFSATHEETYLDKGTIEAIDLSSTNNIETNLIKSSNEEVINLSSATHVETQLNKRNEKDAINLSSSVSETVKKCIETREFIIVDKKDCRICHTSGKLVVEKNTAEKTVSSDKDRESFISKRLNKITESCDSEADKNIKHSDSKQLPEDLNLILTDLLKVFETIPVSNENKSKSDKKGKINIKENKSLMKVKSTDQMEIDYIKEKPENKAEGTTVDLKASKNEDVMSNLNKDIQSDIDVSEGTHFSKDIETIPVSNENNSNSGKKGKLNIKDNTKSLMKVKCTDKMEIDSIKEKPENKTEGTKIDLKESKNENIMSNRNKDIQSDLDVSKGRHFSKDIEAIPVSSENKSKSDKKGKLNIKDNTKSLMKVKCTDQMEIDYIKEKPENKAEGTKVDLKASKNEDVMSNLNKDIQSDIDVSEGTHFSKDIETIPVSNENNSNSGKKGKFNIKDDNKSLIKVKCTDQMEIDSIKEKPENKTEDMLKIDCNKATVDLKASKNVDVMSNLNKDIQSEIDASEGTHFSKDVETIPVSNENNSKSNKKGKFNIKDNNKSLMKVRFADQMETDYIKEKPENKTESTTVDLKASKNEDVMSNLNKDIQSDLDVNESEHFSKDIEAIPVSNENKSKSDKKRKLNIKDNTKSLMKVKCTNDYIKEKPENKTESTTVDLKASKNEDVMSKLNKDIHSDVDVSEGAHFSKDIEAIPVSNENKSKSDKKRKLNIKNNTKSLMKVKCTDQMEIDYIKEKPENKTESTTVDLKASKNEDVMSNLNKDIQSDIDVSEDTHFSKDIETIPVSNENKSKSDKKGKFNIKDNTKSLIKVRYTDQMEIDYIKEKPENKTAGTTVDLKASKIEDVMSNLNKDIQSDLDVSEGRHFSKDIEAIPVSNENKSKSYKKRKLNIKDNTKSLMKVKCTDQMEIDYIKEKPENKTEGTTVELKASKNEDVMSNLNKDIQSEIDVSEGTHFSKDVETIPVSNENKSKSNKKGKFNIKDNNKSLRKVRFADQMETDYIKEKPENKTEGTTVDLKASKIEDVMSNLNKDIQSDLEVSEGRHFSKDIEAIPVSNENKSKSDKKRKLNIKDNTKSLMKVKCTDKMEIDYIKKKPVNKAEGTKVDFKASKDENVMSNLNKDIQSDLNVSEFTHFSKETESNSKGDNDSLVDIQSSLESTTSTDLNEKCLGIEDEKIIKEDVESLLVNKQDTELKDKEDAKGQNVESTDFESNIDKTTDLPNEPVSTDIQSIVEADEEFTRNEENKLPLINQDKEEVDLKDIKMTTGLRERVKKRDDNDNIEESLIVDENQDKDENIKITKELLSNLITKVDHEVRGGEFVEFIKKNKPTQFSMYKDKAGKDIDDSDVESDIDNSDIENDSDYINEEDQSMNYPSERCKKLFNSYIFRTFEDLDMEESCDGERNEDKAFASESSGSLKGNIEGNDIKASFKGKRNEDKTLPPVSFNSSRGGMEEDDIENNSKYEESDVNSSDNERVRYKKTRLPHGPFYSFGGGSVEYSTEDSSEDEDGDFSSSVSDTSEEYGDRADQEMTFEHPGSLYYLREKEGWENGVDSEKESDPVEKEGWMNDIISAEGIDLAELKRHKQESSFDRMKFFPFGSDMIQISMRDEKTFPT